jgi:DNA-binding MarR family transcriptional regulator
MSIVRRKANTMAKPQEQDYSFLDTFGLKGISKRVLLDVVDNGVSTVAEISARLNMPKSSIYDALDNLLKASLINEYSDDRGKSFGISENEQLTRVHAEKIIELQTAQASLLSFIGNRKKEKGVARPRIKFYAGVLGMKQAFRDMPWSKKYTETYLMWPVEDMLDTLDEDFLRWHGEQRFQYGVVINAIEKHSDRKLQTKKHDWLENNLKTKLTRVRYLPKDTDWKMSYWLYGDKCLFASGGKEKIAFTIHSKEFCEVMKIMWDNTWKVALD